MSGDVDDHGAPLLSPPTYTSTYTSTYTPVTSTSASPYSMFDSDSDSQVYRAPSPSTASTESNASSASSSTTSSNPGSNAHAHHTIQVDGSGNTTSDDNPIARRQRIRAQIAKEVMTSEASYVQALDLLFSLYIQPLTVLSRSNTILTSQQLSILFSNLSLITHLSQKFCNTLNVRLQNWTNTSCLADVFLEITPFLRLYTHYVKNHDRATHMLSQLETENKEFGDFVAQANRDPRNRGLSLSSYLIMPIQRIPRYKLLLEELIKHTETHHPDFTPLHQALREITSTASLINASVKRQESRAWLHLPGIDHTNSIKSPTITHKSPRNTTHVMSSHAHLHVCHGNMELRRMFHMLLAKFGRNCCSRGGGGGGFFSWG